MFAIIETGGKQYLVSPKDKIRVEKLDTKGDEVTFDKVLLVSDKDTKIGSPFVSGAKVTARVVNQGRDRKLRIFKYKSKVRYRRRLGHRQHFTELEIQSIA
ncbi:MAG: 50S ribosomal protein L21 [Candidatus Doudnabacteria bacterium RIFCSPHIGHO2_02_FULL_48_21]|uniref:Large ribosomal subunit protein bL21 n=1 Tax=Candidatus Doudnabacteria bacterium RIFCSPLOWO2_02_FULL_48_13 TaxID=1817845 RepID=A0A1F5Q931_9BACT|nr:MAG: 50S ribosomal protein L21 [Candidatus Doudnabacteria bacterium RIFCSPHIGHO2_01_48_18]OGE79592.1 MAG: 50S ribosomal protein L21 [Candidatus Doudnabacteria bacterium RIFCSPHIGHO2_01_FULL_48_180]OGE91119.1 MAG: 50S ribosomal protein L21 [Candidatus Doudnabacteria bacterium RIFCSPHIGHO2_12_FULL_47_25]OGE93809.1 MAG: 50S ribosomal protein L21 [Candidatus Doudnabacteria bacterium RIFCSPHIGHO2_02_FULL_48_21]OGE97995.1 MAG: 50S ribosomal protein L21 [Candidatus Doudnabacteria bacterium RIFCSPLO